MAAEGPKLTPVGEKSLPTKCKTQAVAYCPSMDLIALVTEDEKLSVFRLNGQRVFGGSFGGDPYLGEDEADGEIRGMAWKGNGELNIIGRWGLLSCLFMIIYIPLTITTDVRFGHSLTLRQVACSLSRVEMGRSAS